MASAGLHSSTVRHQEVEPSEAVWGEVAMGRLDGPMIWVYKGRSSLTLAGKFWRKRKWGAGGGGMWKLRPETWKGAGILPGSGGKAVGMVGGQGPEFPARETGASVSSVWSWKHSGGSKGQPPNLLWRGGSE